MKDGDCVLTQQEGFLCYFIKYRDDFIHACGQHILKADPILLGIEARRQWFSLSAEEQQKYQDEAMGSPWSSRHAHDQASHRGQAGPNVDACQPVRVPASGQPDLAQAQTQEANANGMLGPTAKVKLSTPASKSNCTKAEDERPDDEERNEEARTNGMLGSTARAKQSTSASRSKRTKTEVEGADERRDASQSTSKASRVDGSSSSDDRIQTLLAMKSQDLKARARYLGSSEKELNQFLEKKEIVDAILRMEHRDAHTSLADLCKSLSCNRSRNHTNSRKLD